nr:MAG TPA: hypothetical protein [Caudoviricetes sp.]
MSCLFGITQSLVVRNVIPSFRKTRSVGADWVFPYLVAIKTRNP